MRGKLISLFVFLFLVSCSEEDLPDGLYDYQVERLLTGESGTKTWIQIIDSGSCADSVKLQIELVENNTGDSLDISRLVSNQTCTSFETIYIGRADASFPDGRILFTDSLLFSSGDFWMVDLITSQQLRFRINGQSIDYLIGE
ncbi:hypothetical protein [Ekhidna sp.]